MTEFTVRVVVLGDRSAPPASSACKATGKAAGKATGKAAAKKPAAKVPKAAKASKAKAKVSAPRTSAVSKSKPRVSKTSMRKSTLVDSDSDDGGYSGLKGRSAAFWENELL